MSKTQTAIDRVLEQRQGAGFRRHLGASIIGRPCARQIWYTFRWARRSSFRGRILRLFDRGNREEERFIKWLRDAGIHVVSHDPETNKQFTIEDHAGHFGGSMDAQLFDTPDYPGAWVLGEFKTHGDDSFKELKKQKVKKAKLEHWVQMQIYMHYRNLPAALYFAINKNDDDMYIEEVAYDREAALMYIDRAARIIASPIPPERISESPGWYICRMCDYQLVCHHGEAKDMNCRTCEFSAPIEKAQWLCTSYQYILSEQDQKRGCTTHRPIKE